LAKARSENEELRSIITEQEKEIQRLRSQLKSEQQPKQSDQEWIESYLAERAITHPDLRPFEWSMELVTFALKVFSDYVWEHYLSDSQKAELKLVDIRAYLQPSKLKFLPTEFNLKLVVELGGDVG
jgi:hypothetical protein